MSRDEELPLMEEQTKWCLKMEFTPDEVTVKTATTLISQQHQHRGKTLHQKKSLRLAESLMANASFSLKKNSDKPEWCMWAYPYLMAVFKSYCQLTSGADIEHCGYILGVLLIREGYEPYLYWCHKLAPENTMMSFEKAVENEAFGLETDVFLSIDEVPFLMHDHNLRRTTDIRE
ncbi:hypothetical protein QTO34_003946, partial [Cnephaeus nilssonii]